jgi:predicted kinase
LLSALCAGILIWNRRIPRPGDSMELVILIGLQGSGKSTFYRARFAETHVHISKDNFRHVRHPSRRQAMLVDEALRAGRSVVVDNTNPTVADRAPLIAQAQAHGATVVGYYLSTPFALSLERNRRRSGKQRVPDVALYATNKRLEPPSYAEGFDRLFYVGIADDGTAVIEDWNDRDEEGLHGS